MADHNVSNTSTNTQGKLMSENADLTLPHGPGPYIGTIMNVADPNYMGRLKVWIPEISRSQPEVEGKWITVSYAPPFYGATNLVDARGEANVTNTSQSYGMWFVPPDIGVQVLVMFANGNSNKGFWFACIPNQLQNHMIPGIAHRSSTTNAVDNDPITEYNKNKITGSTAVPGVLYGDEKTAPAHLFQKSTLEAQGLIGDKGRGVTTSTVRRETPTGVFGISTPGPVAKRVNANAQSGKDYYTVTGRKGGHQFVMDDGDIEGHSQLIRIRSSGGGQILINDTMGVIYVINQAGTAWIEMTPKGKIDVYGKDSISIHSENDINLTADNNMNLLASNSFNLVSPTINIEGVDIRSYGKGSIRNKTPNYVTSADSWSLNTANGAGGGASSSPGTGIRMSSSQAIEMVAQGNLFLQTAANLEQIATGKIILAASGNLALNADGQLQLNGVGGIYEETKAGAGTIAKFTVDVDKDFTSGDNKGHIHPVTGWTGAKNWFDGAADKPSHSLQAQRDSGVVDIPKPYNSGVDVSHVPITPQHEPWGGHEVSFVGSSRPRLNPQPAGGTGGSSTTSATPSPLGGTPTTASAAPAAAPAAAPPAGTPAASSTPITPASDPKVQTYADYVQGLSGEEKINALRSASAAIDNLVAATGMPRADAAKQIYQEKKAWGSPAPAPAAGGSTSGSTTSTSQAAPTATRPATPVSAAPLAPSTSAIASRAATGGSTTASPTAPTAPTLAAPNGPTVTDPKRPDGEPTAASGAGYNIQSVTTVSSVEGFVDFTTPPPLVEMLKEIGLKNWPAYREAMAGRVSNGRYALKNSLGYIGRYSLSPEFLVDAGVMTAPGAWAPAAEEIKVPKADGQTIFSYPGSPQLTPGTQEAFYLDTALQDKLFIFYTYLNFRLLRSYGIISKLLTTDRAKAGWLAMAQLSTPGKISLTGLSKFSPVLTIMDNNQIKAATEDGTSLANGCVGLFAYWKVGNRNPETFPGISATGQSLYDYYKFGSQTQS